MYLLKEHSYANEQATVYNTIQTVLASIVYNQI